MKKLNFILMGLYLLSLFLPFWRLDNPDTFQYVSHNAFDYFSHSWREGILFLLLIILGVFLRVEGKVGAALLLGISLAGALFYYLLYPLLDIRSAFFADFGMFQIGYYLSFALLVALLVSCHLNRCQEGMSK
jgi:hypothetical protein